MKKLIGLLTIAVVLSGTSMIAIHTKNHAVNESGSVANNSVYLTYDDGPGPAVIVNPTPTSTNTTNS